jgi:hypothetical protein
MIQREELLKIGFKEIPHFTLMNSLIYDLGRNRQLSIGCLSEPNEMMFICESEENNNKNITDSICIHNFDYDGYISMEKIKSLIKILTNKEL